MTHPDETFIRKVCGFVTRGYTALGLGLLILMQSACERVDEDPQAGVVIYRSGFEASDDSSAYRSGELIGQDEWFAYMDTNEDAVTVSTEQVRTGSQSLMLDGSKMQTHPFGIIGGFYGRRLNYDPIANQTPLIELSADVKIEADEMEDQCDGGIALILDGSILVGVGANADDEIRFFLQNQTGDGELGPDYTLGEWVNVRAVFDFENKTATGYLNDVLIAKVPFIENAPATVTAVGLVMVGKEDMTGVTTQVDNLSVTGFAQTEPEARRPVGESAMVMIPRGSKRFPGTIGVVEN